MKKKFGIAQIFTFAGMACTAAAMLFDTLSRDHEIKEAVNEELDKRGITSTNSTEEGSL